MIRLYGFPYSTNMERVQLVLAHKGIDAEYVGVPVDDRSRVIEVSGQSRVPVIDDDGTIVFDSPRIIEYLDDAFPVPPLYPPGPGRRAEMRVFIDWFNRVWKVPPNAIEAELGKPEPDRDRIAAWGDEMRAALHLFDGMLAGRTYLMGDELSAADCIAWPFLRYAHIPPDPEDTYLFHRILVENMPLDESHGRLRDWILRVAEHPMTPVAS